jgi:hypothetical protein
MSTWSGTTRSALILADATARYLVADDFLIGFPSEEVEAMIGRARGAVGTEARAPSHADDQRVAALVGQAPAGHRQPTGGPRPPAGDAGG